MGNSLVNKQQQPHSQSSHQKFKMMTINSQKNQMVLTIPFQQQSDIAKWQLKLKEIQTIYEEFVLFPIKHQISQKGLCGSSGLIKITYEYFPYVLEEEIMNRAQNNNYFEQSQLWYLLYVLVSTSVQFNKIQSKVGDIRPHNILINENGQLKIANLYSWPNEVDNLSKTNFDKTITYLSPQQFQQIKSTKGRNTKNNIINQSFSIGLTMLHAGLLKSQQTLYNFKKCQFEQKKLQGQLEEWKQFQFWSNELQKKIKYSSQFKNVVKALLIMEPKDRIRTTDLFELLRPNDQEILNLKPFDYPRLILHGQKIQSAYIPNNQSPKLSSIKKKQYNQFDSIGLQISYGGKESKIIKFDQGSSGVRIGNIQKRQQSKKIQERKQLPAEDGYKIVHPIHPRRQGSRSRKTIQEEQKDNNSPIKNVYLTNQPMLNSYNYSQANRYSNPILTQTYTATNPQIKFNHMTFNPLNVVQQPTIYQNQNQNNFSINQTNSTYTVPTSNNINLTTSGYTYVDKNNIQPIYVPSKDFKGEGGPDKLQFLKKIDEQLNKSRNMFPS